MPADQLCVATYRSDEEGEVFEPDDSDLCGDCVEWDDDLGKSFLHCFLLLLCLIEKGCEV